MSGQPKTTRCKALVWMPLEGGGEIISVCKRRARPDEPTCAEHRGFPQVKS